MIFSESTLKSPLHHLQDKHLPGAGVRSSAHGKGHEEGGLAYAKAGSSLRSPPGNSRVSTLKTRVCLLSALCSHLHLWLHGGLSPTTSLKKRVILQLQLIKFLGVIVFQPTNSFGSPLACLNRFFGPHVIAQSLPTVRGMRCSKLSKYRFLWAVKRLIRNCIGFSLVGPMFAAKSPYPLPAVSLAVYWLIWLV